MSTKLLSANSHKSLSKNKEMFTTRQVAEQLTVDIKTVRTNAKKCLPNKTFENGKITYFTKEEVTVLLDYMQQHNNRTDLTSTTVVQVTSTELTPALKLKKAMELAQEAYEEELQRIKAEKALIENERDSLQIELDQNKDWYSIKRMQKLNPGVIFKYSLLKKESKRLGYDIKKVFDQNYGEVNAYHKDVWESLFFDTIEYCDESEEKEVMYE